MKEKFNNLLLQAEAQHEKLVVLHAQQNEQLTTLKAEKNKLIHLLTMSKGQITAYKKSLETINENKE